MKKLLILFLFVFSTIAFAQAQIGAGNYSMQSGYVYGDTISGWINLSFEDEPLDSEFTDSEGNTITLEQFLNNSNYTYECSTKECLPDFTESSPAALKTITLNNNKSAILGFQLKGDIEQIKSAEFNVNSNAAESSKNQLKIDFLNDGVIDTGNTKASSNYAEDVNFGCYDSTGESVSSSVPLDETPFCQAINLSEAPGFRIGAWINKVGSGSDSVRMQIYSKDSTSPITYCDIANNLITTGKYYSCYVNLLVPEKDTYYVCISRERGSTENFFVKAYSSSNEDKMCGFHGKPVRDFGAAYEIFAQPILFGQVGTIKINDTLPNQDSLGSMFEEYIQDKYGSLDCSNGCNIPIKITSYADNQQITISNVLIKYDETDIPGFEEKNIYDFTKEVSHITSPFQKMKLDGLFKVKSIAKIRDYTLKYDGKKLIDDESIEVKNITFSLSPQATVADYPTTFVLYSSATEPFLEYDWDFGDNKTATTSTNSTNHSYDSIGNYTLSVTMQRYGGGEIKKEYKIVVSSPKKLIESNLELMKNSLTQIQSEYSKLTVDEQAMLADKIDLDELQSKIDSIETKYKLSKSENDYEDIVSEILNLNVPKGLIKITSPSAPFFTKEEDVSVDDIKALGYDPVYTNSDEEITNAVLYWNVQNLDVTSSMSEVILTYSTGEETSLRKFTLTINPKTSVGEYNIFYNKYLLNLVGGQEDTGEDTIAHITKSGTSKVEFLTTEDLDLASLPVSISPKISELSLVGDVPEATDKKKGWIIVIALFSLAVFGLLIYNILRKWYQTKYEKYLFSDRNNLYNVMIYVNNSKKQGLEDSEIRKNLSRAGWSGEQIRYIMRKFENKETGMPELTLKKKTRELTHVKKANPSESINKNHTNLNK